MLQQSILAKPTAPDVSQRWFVLLFGLLLAGGLGYVGHEVFEDLSAVRTSSTFPYLFLGIALLIALGFEFVNGFHDTANAVATVIYTHALPPRVAVVWSGLWNFVGVLLSSGTVAFGIVSLLPVELILQVGDQAGFAMVFALLLAAIAWNLGTWYLGLPTSSSHTLIGSIIGVGIVNQWMQGPGDTSGVDWTQAGMVGNALLLSPLIGFSAAALLLWSMKRVIRNPALYRPPQGQQPPPPGTRALLILTCTGVSFAHGSNDGQKGMGLIMLILIGTFPSAYALNQAVPAENMETFVARSYEAADVLGRQREPSIQTDMVQSRAVLSDYLRTGAANDATIPAISKLAWEIAEGVSQYGSYAAVPGEMRGNIRNDMYLIHEALERVEQRGLLRLAAENEDIVQAYRDELDRATMFIPTWVKVAVAFALGLGTMVGWKRIVVTVGEKIGTHHLTYAQGACAETVAMSTIAAADVFGLPVSTTHVLSSAVAGTMVANRAGLRGQTVGNIVTAWVLTLPISIALAGGLYWLLRQVV